MILLTGGTGMLGSHLAAALLASGQPVRALVRRPDAPSLLDGLAVQKVAGDVTEPDSLAAAVAGVDAVVHTAGVVSYWRARREEQERVNVDGTRNLLQAVCAAGVPRFLITSSIATLGWVPEGEIGDEETAWNWDGMDIGYFETKRAAEQLVLAETRVQGLAVNPGIVFGTADIHFNAGRMFQQILAGGPPGVPPGHTTVATIADVVAGHLAALDRGRAGQRYVLGGHTLSFKELFGEIAAAMGRSAPQRELPAALVRLVGWGADLSSRVTGREPYMTPQLAAMVTRNRRYSSAKAIRELDYPVSPLRPCLESVYNWYVERGLLTR